MDDAKVQAVDQVFDKLRVLAPEERLAAARAFGALDQLLRNLGDRAEQVTLTDLARAIEIAELGVELAHDAHECHAAARFHRVLGQALAYANRFDESLASLTRAANVAEAIGDALEAARARHTSVHSLARLGRYDEAISAGRRALQAFQQAGDHLFAGKSAVNLGVTYRMRDQPAEALRYFDQARPVFRDVPVALAQIESNRAEALLDLNRFEESERAFNAALALFEQHGVHRGARIVEGNLADLMSRQGRLEQALRHFERSRSFLERDAAPGDLARIQAEQAEALAAVGMLNEAAQEYRNALPVLEECGLQAEAGRASEGLARVLALLGRFDESRTALAAAARIFNELAQTTALARVRLIEGQIESATGDRNSARRLFCSALELSVQRPAESAIAELHLGLLDLEDGQLESAEARLTRATDIAASLNLAPLLADAHHARARLHSAMGSPQAARTEFERALQQVERVRGTLQAERFRAAFLGNRLALFEDFARLLVAERTPDEAFGVVERAKSRALLDLVASAVALTEQTPGDASSESTQLSNELARVRAELNAWYSRLEPHGVSGGPMVAEDWLVQTRQREQQLAMLESRLGAAQPTPGLFTSIADVRAVQEALGARAALIEYFIARGRLMAFVITRQEVVAFGDLGPARMIGEQIERIRFQIDRAIAWSVRAKNVNTLLDDVRREFQALHRLIWAPLLAVLENARRIIIVPHGPLHGVPFHALWDGAQYLVERHELMYAPSASVFVQLAPDRPRTPLNSRGAVVVGVPDAAAPGIEMEARSVAQTLPNARLLMGNEATAKRFLESAADAEVLHLACHGRFTTSAPWASGLRLADRWLTLRELYQMRLSATLVCLSGCETGVTTVHAGDELIGLLRGFIAAGASNVLVSLWTLPDQSAADFMASLYSMCYSSNQPARVDLCSSTCLTQRKMLQVKPHPAFWAPFALIGRG